MSRSPKRLPEVELNMTVEDFANWLLSLGKEYTQKQIWEIDVSYPYKGKDWDIEISPSGSHISIKDGYE